MPASSLRSNSTSSVVEQFRAEFENPTKASRRASHAARTRAVSGRRRFVDPTTCERDYSTAELEFMQAMQEYKQSSGRKFPTWSEVLEVLQGIGYRKLA